MCVCATVIALSEVTAAAQDAPPGIEYLLTEAPAYGVVLPLENGAGLTYISDSGEADHFSFLAYDGGGYTLSDVYVDPAENLSYVRVEDGAGPGPTGANMVKIPPREGEAGPRPPVTAPKPAGTTTVTIYVDQPGRGGDRDPYDGTDFGHTFVEYIDPDTGTTVSAGFYPRPGRPGGSAGVVGDDTGSDYDVKKTFEISSVQREAIDEKVDRDRGNPPGYKIGKRTCVEWAIEVLGEAGIVVKTEPTYNIPGVPGGLNNCGDLGEDLIDKYGGARNPPDPALP